MIAIVKANFNIEITDLLLEGCVNHLREEHKEFDLFECPGVVETVIYTKKLISLQKYNCIIVIGAVIKGDTDHYEYVCSYVTNGIAHLSASQNTPIIFGILTTQNEELAFERAAVNKMNKGKEFAETAIFMINAFEIINN